MDFRDLWASLRDQYMWLYIVIYFLHDNMHIHSFSSVLAVKLGQIISSLVWKCASDHDRVNVDINT